MEFPLNIRKRFNLIPNAQYNYGDFSPADKSTKNNNLQYVQAHKGAQIWIPDTTIARLAVEYEKSIGMASAGIRIKLRLDPDRHYQVRIRAYLIRGDQAFIYCEDENSERLIPRCHWITQETRNQTFILEFTANTPVTWLGILFYDGSISYTLFIEDFVVLEIPERNENAPQGPVLTHLLPESLRNRLFNIPNHANTSTNQKTSEIQSVIPSPSHAPSSAFNTSGTSRLDAGTETPVEFSFKASSAVEPMVATDCDQTLQILHRIRQHQLSNAKTTKRVEEVSGPQSVPVMMPQGPIIITLALVSETAIHENRSALEALSRILSYRIILHIPYKVEEIPTWLIHLPNIELNRCPDYGPLTSLLGLLPILDTPRASTWLFAGLRTDRIPISLITGTSSSDLIGGATDLPMDQERLWERLRNHLLPRYQNRDMAHWNMRDGDCTVLLPAIFLEDDIYEIVQSDSITKFGGAPVLATYLDFSGYKIPEDLKCRVDSIRKILANGGIWREKTKTSSDRGKEPLDIDRALPAPSSLREGLANRPHPHPRRLTANSHRNSNNHRNRFRSGSGVRPRSQRRRIRVSKGRKPVQQRIHTAHHAAPNGTRLPTVCHQKLLAGPQEEPAPITASSDIQNLSSTILHRIGPVSATGGAGGSLIRTIGGNIHSNPNNNSNNNSNNNNSNFHSNSDIISNPLILPFERHGVRNANSGRVAVIVEPRADSLLILILGHFLTRLDRSWNVQLFHGKRNKQMITESPRLRNFIKNGELILTDTGVENYTRQEYSRLLLSDKFYQQCQGDLILIFQMDSYLCDHPKRNLSDYYQYDYVGAPWKTARRSLLNPGGRKLIVGNGGLSLRRKTKMIQICELARQRRFGHLHKENEDLVISSFLQSSLLKTPAKLPSAGEAALFSSETIYTRGAIGGHRPWTYHGPNVIESLSRECNVFKPLFAGRYFGS